VVSVTIEQPRVTKAMRVPMIQPTAKAKKKAMLSKKQIEILRLVNDGLANEEIAKAMCITEGDDQVASASNLQPARRR